MQENHLRQDPADRSARTMSCEWKIVKGMLNPDTILEFLNLDHDLILASKNSWCRKKIFKVVGVRN